MKITDQQLARFNGMVNDFAKKNGLGAEITTDTLRMDHTFIRFTGKSRSKEYCVIWDKVTSLTDAGTHVFADALNFFGLNDHSHQVARFDISNVIYNYPATIVLWADGTKTVVKCQEGDWYSKEVGLALCFAKKALGNQGNFNNVFKKWVPEEVPEPAAIEIPKLNIEAGSLASEIMAKFADAFRHR